MFVVSNYLRKLLGFEGYPVLRCFEKNSLSPHFTLTFSSPCVRAGLGPFKFHIRYTHSRLHRTRICGWGRERSFVFRLLFLFHLFRSKVIYKELFWFWKSWVHFAKLQNLWGYVFLKSPNTCIIPKSPLKPIFQQELLLYAHFLIKLHNFARKDFIWLDFSFWIIFTY